VALALVSVLTVNALSLYTGVARTLVNILVAALSGPAIIAIAVESVEFILALTVNAWVGQALVDLRLAVASSVSRVAATNVWMMSDRVLGEGAASCP